MCIDRGCVVTGESKLCSECVLTEGALVQGRVRVHSEDVLIGRLFIETGLLTVKENNDMLCHSHLDGSQGYAAMICYYKIPVTEHDAVSNIVNRPS